MKVKQTRIHTVSAKHFIVVDEITDLCELTDQKSRQALNKRHKDRCVD